MLDRKFMGREVFKRPTCPFCGLLVEPPRELTTRRQGEVPVGSCSCGAVYACDESGRNVGAAQIEAIVFGCNMDWDLAWNLLPEEDYRLEIVDFYDYQTHLIIPGGFYQSRRIAGVLVFVRLHDDVLDVTGEGVQNRLHEAEKIAEKAPKQAQLPSEKTHSLSKKDVENHVLSRRMDPLLAAAPTDRKILRTLQRLLYSGDDTLRHRAAEALGRVSAVVGDTNPGAVSKILQELFYAITDTAASSWGAFEAVGEIIRHKPELYAGYLPQLFAFLGDTTRRAVTLETIATVAEVRPDLLRKHTYHFLAFLEDPEPGVRGQAVRLLGFLQAAEMRQDLEKLLKDHEELRVYREGDVVLLSVGRLAREALDRL
ncbi:MAG: hypothetical protein PVG49_16165 [Desulfobacteraceae bacterium]|jgi:hypothetical protein